MGLGSVLLPVKAAASFSTGVFVYPSRSTICSRVGINACAHWISYVRQKLHVINLKDV